MAATRQLEGFAVEVDFGGEKFLQNHVQKSQLETSSYCPAMEFPDNTEQTESYLLLLNEHERALAAYVHSLVPRREDAEDILQEAKIVLWRKFSEFEPGTNFKAWARKIALGLILNHRRKEKTRATSPVDQEFIEAVAAELDRRGDELERRGEMLHDCVKRLPEAHRQLIVWRYFEAADIDEIARKTGRSEGAVYRLLSRIRENLGICLKRKLGEVT